MWNKLFGSRDEPLHRFETEVSVGARRLFWSFLALTIFTRVFQATGHWLPDFSTFFRTVGLNPMNASGFGSFILLYLCARPSRHALVLAAAVGLILEVYYHVVFWPRASTIYHFLIAGPGLAASALVALLYQAGFDKVPVARTRARLMLQIGLVFLMYPTFAGLLLGGLSGISASVYDAFAYQWEAGLGFFPTQQIAIWLKANPQYDLLFVGVYSRLPLVLVGGFAVNLWYYKKSYSNLFLAAIAGGAVSCAIYPILPMIGIDLFVGTPPYPDGVLPLAISTKPVLAPAEFPRTCYPSMHATWTLLPFLALRRVSRPVAAIFAICAITTMVSAMSHQVGHFLLDILIAFPFAVALQGMSALPSKNNQIWRWRCIAFGLISTVGVALLVRWTGGPLSSPLVWAFWLGLLGLVAASFWFEQRLAEITLDDLGRGS